MTVGQNIRALRKKKGLTQAQLGKLCGITGPMLSGYERGETLPKKKALESMTIDAARLCGIADRVGSIEPGKDADIVIWDGEPLDFYSSPKAVFIDGCKVLG